VRAAKTVNTTVRRPTCCSGIVKPVHPELGRKHLTINAADNVSHFGSA
jgi:hypothetical protein